jgi:DNA-binding HxlR family transcriptional regulator
MSAPRAKMTRKFPGCSVEAALSFLDGKWKGVILFHLLDGLQRFNGLRRKMPGVTQRMLTKQLRELEDAGLISRTVHPVVPPHVDYALTDLGRTMEPIIRALGSWGDAYVFCKDGVQATIGQKPEAHIQAAAIRYFDAKQ